MLDIVPFTLAPNDDMVARDNLTRWLAEQDAVQSITALETDRMPGYVMLTATLADGLVVTCLLDTSRKLTRPWEGIDLLWPWSWRA